MLPPELSAAASRLCTACGLCCNGVLFQIVRLQPEDSVRALESRGMKLNRKKHEPYFRQPCSFLGDRTCQHYAARPWRCRVFECRQLNLLAEGHATEASTRAWIEVARSQVAEVERLLEVAGNTDVDRPLQERYAQVIEEVGHTDAHLVSAMTALNALLDNHFRVEGNLSTASLGASAAPSMGRYRGA